MKKIKRLRKLFRNSIYKTEVWLVAGYSSEEMIDWFKKKFPNEEFSKPWNEDTGGSWTRGDGKSPIIWIKKYNDFYTLVHESVHLVTYIMDRKGIPISRENDETMAYLLEFYTREFWREISKL